VTNFAMIEDRGEAIEVAISSLLFYFYL